MLAAAELAELQTFARKPGVTVDEAKKWLLDRGHHVARSSVWRWQRHLRRLGSENTPPAVFEVMDKLQGMLDRLRRDFPDPRGCNGDASAPSGVTQETPEGAVVSEFVPAASGGSQ